MTVHSGEVVGLGGPDRRRPHRTRQDDLRRLRPRRAATIAVEGRTVAIGTPRDAIDAGHRLRAGGAKGGRAAARNVGGGELHPGDPPPTHADFASSSVARSSRIAADYVERLRVKTPSLNQPIGKLSGGNQQKVVLARWLATQAQGADSRRAHARHRCRREGRDLCPDRDTRREGIGILLISSELPEILRLSDRIVCMQQGRITGELSASEATEERVLQLCMAHDLTKQSSRVTVSGGKHRERTSRHPI